jgi:PAS domain S-box-containing protein
LQSYIDLSGFIITVLDTNGKVSSINKQGLEVFGYERESIVGSSWFSKFVPPSDKVVAMKAFNNLLKGGSSEYFESKVLTKSGEERLISWHNSLVRNEQGVVSGVLNIGEDITDKRLRDEEIKRLKEEESINNARKDFLLLITHELKQPLTPIMGYADLLKEGEVDVEKLKYLDRIIGSSQEMYDLITKIISLMRIETGQLLFNFKQVKLKELVTDALRRKAPVDKLRSIRIMSDVDNVSFTGDYNCCGMLLLI